MPPHPRTLTAAALVVCLVLRGSAGASDPPLLPAADIRIWAPTTIDAAAVDRGATLDRKIDPLLRTVQFPGPLPEPSWSEPVMPLPPLDDVPWAGRTIGQPPWAGHRFPRISRAAFKVAHDYANFYRPENLICYTAAFGAGAIMANTGFDTTMQTAWQEGVRPTGLGTFFAGCNDIGDGWYALPIFGTAAVTGLVFEANPVGDVIGEWGSRTLRMFVVGAPPVYVMQLATGASRPGESSAGSDWKPFNDNNGVSGHAFIGAIPFLAAADMVESPLLKGTLYVCSTFVAFARVNENAHYPSQVFLGWYLAWASARAVDDTEMQFAGFEMSVVPLPTADLGGLAVEARW